MATPKVVKTVKTKPSPSPSNKKQEQAKGTKNQKPKPSTTKSASKNTKSTGTFSRMMSGDGVMIWGRDNFLIMLGGLAVIAVGYLLMLGGRMPSPDVWEPERIYSFRRITLAPLVILIGLGIEVYAIFKK